MVQPDATLIEYGVAVLGRTAGDRDRGAAAYHVEELGVLHDRLHAHEAQHFLVEGHGAGQIVDGQMDMRDSVDFHRMTLPGRQLYIRRRSRFSPAPSSESQSVA